MHRITVKVIPRAKKESIELVEEGVYRIRVSTPPEDGKANKRVITLLAHELGVSPGKISILRGATARTKILSIHTK